MLRGARGVPPLSDLAVVAFSRVLRLNWLYARARNLRVAGDVCLGASADDRSRAGPWHTHSDG